MAKAWLINGRGIATKVKNATKFSTNQIKDLGIDANRQCPNCSYRIDNSDVSLEWPGLPSGVKFDPSDPELLEHLAGKVRLENSKPHPFIDEFIPTLDEDEGICYTHPENLPGVKKDGSSVHFFHRTSNAYATGQRKRRKIQRKSPLNAEHVRWHKTGKTKSVIENGVHKGWKKIMVLYKSSKRGSKPDKSNWVMHQYHLGAEEDEKEGEFVVSKVFYQQQSKQTTENLIIEESDASRASPKTPKTNTPHPPRSEKHALCNEAGEDKIQHLSDQDEKFIDEEPQCRDSSVLQDEGLNCGWLAGESQGVDEPNLINMDESLFCNEKFDSFPPFDGPGLKHIPYFSDCIHRTEPFEQDLNISHRIPELDNIEVDTPPDFQLADLQFGSQESIMGWLDRL